MGTWPGPSFMTCTPVAHARRRAWGSACKSYDGRLVTARGFSSLWPVQRNKAHATVLGGDQRQSEPAVLDAQAPRAAFEGAPRPGEEFILYHLSANASFVFHNRSRILLNPMTVQVSDSAIRVGGPRNSDRGLHGCRGLGKRRFLFEYLRHPRNPRSMWNSEGESLRQRTIKSKFQRVNAGEKHERIDIGGESRRKVSTHSGFLTVVELPPLL